MTADIQWLPHDGGPNPVREGETLTHVRFGLGEVKQGDGDWRWLNLGNDWDITHYAVTPPRREPVDWSKPLVTNTGAMARVNFRLANGGYAVTSDFGSGDPTENREIKEDGSHAYGEGYYVRNAPEPAAEPAPDPIFAAIHAEIAKVDARRAMLVKMLEVGE